MHVRRNEMRVYERCNLHEMLAFQQIEVSKIVLNKHDCQKLRNVFDNVLNSLGLGFGQVIHEELDRAGVSLDFPCSSIEDIENALKPMVGTEAALLL